MDMNKITKGGWLAGKKKLVSTVIAVVIALGAYLTGDADLVELVNTIFTAL